MVPDAVSSPVSSARSPRQPQQAQPHLVLRGGLHVPGAPRPPGGQEAWRASARAQDGAPTTALGLATLPVRRRGCRPHLAASEPITSDSLNRRRATRELNEQFHALLLVLREGERLKRLIDNLLSLQRLRAGFGLVNPGPVWLYPLLYEVVGHFRTPLVRQRLVIDCASDLPPVLGEAPKLQDAVANLLGNAVKYAPGGSLIELGARTEGNAALLWVRDEGPGIPAPERRRIFERFYRLNGEAQPAGTGLGLALVEEIARAHGGQVWVEPAAEKGSTFFLRLPLAP